MGTRFGPTELKIFLLFECIVFVVSGYYIVSTARTVLPCVFLVQVRLERG